MVSLTFADPAECMRACLIVSCIGAFVSNLEFLCVVTAFRTTGPYSWPVIATEQVGRLGIRPLQWLTAVPAGPSAMKALLVVRGACLAILPFLTLQSDAFAIVATVLTATTLAFNFRRYIGDDGSDQMSTITTVAIWLCAGLGRSELALSLGLWFLAAQAGMSYTAAGVAKAMSREWRDGSALFKIFNTQAYGIRAIARFLREHPRLGWWVCWSVIVAECAFPTIFFVPVPIMLGMLMAGVVFHATCAAIMGLNSFLWAFAATYPAVAHANHLIRDMF